MVGLAFALDAIVTELVTVYLRSLPADQRKPAIDRMAANVAYNGKALVDLAPQQLLSNAIKIQAAGNKIIGQLLQEVMASLATEVAAPDAPK